MDSLVQLNVGGTNYMTLQSTLLKFQNSIFPELFDKSTSVDSVTGAKVIFIDRDGNLFRFILEFLRIGRVELPSNFGELQLLKREALYYKLTEMANQVEERSPSCITVGYRGTFAFGRDGLADVKFRKLSRILVSGKVNVCRDVFKDTLNDSRDPDTGFGDRYSSRYFLKHNILEQAFEMLYESGYCMVGACGSGTNSSALEIKPGQDSEENKWQHYNEFVFSRLN